MPKLLVHYYQIQFFLMSPKSYSFHSQTIIEFVDNFYERRQARYLTIVPLTEFDFTLT